MSRIELECRLKSCGADYPVDRQGNVITGTEPEKHYFTLYIGESTIDGKKTDYVAPHEMLPNLQMEAYGLAIPKETLLRIIGAVYAKVHVTMEIEDEALEATLSLPASSTQPDPEAAPSTT